MAEQRFPKDKYLRQLAAMQNDLNTWCLAYRHAAEAHPDDWLGSRFEARVSVLTDAIRLLEQTRNTFYALPRLS